MSDVIRSNDLSSSLAELEEDVRRFDVNGERANAMATLRAAVAELISPENDGVPDQPRARQVLDSIRYVRVRVHRELRSFADQAGPSQN